LQLRTDDIDRSGTIVVSEREAVQMMVTAAQGQRFRRPRNAERELIIRHICSGREALEALNLVLGVPENEPSSRSLTRRKTPN
jgi:hypothetical protein